MFQHAEVVKEFKFISTYREEISEYNFKQGSITVMVLLSCMTEEIKRLEHFIYYIG